jgi:hypothetical protein
MRATLLLLALALVGCSSGPPPPAPKPPSPLGEDTGTCPSMCAHVRERAAAGDPDCGPYLQTPKGVPCEAWCGTFRADLHLTCMTRAPTCAAFSDCGK